jgi:hypothetical protein
VLASLGAEVSSASAHAATNSPATKHPPMIRVYFTRETPLRRLGQLPIANREVF